MRVLFVVLSLVGSVTSADQMLVSCREGASTVSVYSVDNYGLVAEVNNGNEVFRYNVKKVPPVLPDNGHYTSLFDSLRYNSTGSDLFRLQLCAAGGCHRSADGSRAGAVKFNQHALSHLSCTF